MNNTLNNDVFGLRDVRVGALWARFVPPYGLELAPTTSSGPAYSILLERRCREGTGLIEVAISEFKAKCLALLERVRQTKKPLRITRFGKPVAEVMPPSPEAAHDDWIGSMKDSVKILGDIVSPIIDEEDIEAMRD